MNNSTVYKNSRDDWSTPDWLFQQLDNEFCFTLDPCANYHNHKCKKYFTIADDGLSRSWRNESVFMNPPYGKNIKHWVKKAYEESLNLETTIVCLLPASTDTKWFHDYCLYGEIRFIKGRLRFGGSSQNAPFPSMIVIFN